MIDTLPGGRKQENFSYSGLAKNGTKFQISSYPYLIAYTGINMLIFTFYLTLIDDTAKRGG